MDMQQGKARRGACRSFWLVLVVSSHLVSAYVESWWTVSKKTRVSQSALARTREGPPPHVTRLAPALLMSTSALSGTGFGGTANHHGKAKLARY